MTCLFFANATLTATLTAAALPLAGSQDLKELARAQGGKVFSNVDVEVPFAPLESVVRKADVVVRAQIVGKESQLTRSAEDVVTYYRFLPIKAFKDTIGITPARQTPQMTFPLVYFEMGGVVEVDGLEIHQSVSDMADPPVTVGEDVLLFLTWDKDKNAFRRQNGPFGLLRIHGDTVAEARKTIKRNLAGKRASEVEAEIERLVAGVPRR